MLKKCNLCKKQKALNEYHFNSSTKDGYSYRCKECQKKVYKNFWNNKKQEREYAIKNPYSEEAVKYFQKKARKKYEKNVGNRLRDKLADFFIAGGRATTKELHEKFYDTEYTGKTLISYHISQARKILRKQGLFLTNAIKSKGLYYITNNPVDICEEGLRNKELAVSRLDVVQDVREALSKNEHDVDFLMIVERELLEIMMSLTQTKLNSLSEIAKMKRLQAEADNPETNE